MKTIHSGDPIAAQIILANADHFRDPKRAMAIAGELTGAVLALSVAPGTLYLAFGEVRIELTIDEAIELSVLLLDYAARASDRSKLN